MKRGILGYELSTTEQSLRRIGLAADRVGAGIGARAGAGAGGGETQPEGLVVAGGEPKIRDTITAQG